MNIGSQIQNINIDKIIPNRTQPRLIFDDKSLQELANSIKEHGIIQPLVLRQIGDKYEIIAGERRYKAAVAAGMMEVPCIISEVDENESAELALVENIQRKNLNSIEEAKSYKNLLNQQNITQEELAQKMGVSQSTIANKLRLLNLSEEVQNALLQEKISERHARSLLQISDSIKQVDMLNRIVNERLTVRQLDEEIAKLNDGNISQVQDNLSSQPSENNNISETSDLTANLFNPFSNSSDNIFDSSDNENIETFDLSDQNLIENDSQKLDEEESLEEEPKSNPLKNILSTFDRNSKPSLDDEVTNMTIDPDDNMFSNFNPEPIYNDENPEEEHQNVIIKEVEVPVEDPLYKIDSNNLNSVKIAYQHLCDEVKKAGYNLNNEEFDFEDLYQLIIKIEK